MTYEEYLNSPEWRYRAEQAKKRDGQRCCLCNSSGPLEVHHRTYERLGHEDLDDLTSLCDPCHALFSAATRVRRPTGGCAVLVVPPAGMFDAGPAAVPTGDDRVDEATHLRNNLRMARRAAQRCGEATRGAYLELAARIERQLAALEPPPPEPPPPEPHNGGDR